MNAGRALVGLLVFPGLLYALPAAWLMLWIERKARARMQGRIGPPFYQPFFDFVKLMAKRTVPLAPFDAILAAGLPILAGSSLLVALGLLPVLSGPGGFAGDVILLVALLEVPGLAAVLAGFASRSIFGQLGGAREAVLSVVSSVPFLGAVVALAISARSLRLVEVASGPAAAVRWPAVIALVLCLPLKLRINPFSLVNAEQEIYAGPLTEYAGPKLALWELVHGMEWVAWTGLAACFGLPLRSGRPARDIALMIAGSFLLVVLLAVAAAGTARLKVRQAGLFYWSWGLGLTLLALVLAVIPRGGGGG
ncbi:MAG: complex I subunit 1 family protein [Acidobacteriota bacterium]